MLVGTSPTRAFRTLLPAVLAASLLSAVVPPASAAVTLRVPQDHPTIQAAVNAALPGDTIVIGPGTYYENVIVDKSISLIGENFDAADPRNNTTILDGGGGTVISVKSGITPGPSFTGLVIRNGLDGILVRSAISLENSYLTGNVDSLQSVAGASGAVTDNVFEASTDDAIDINHPTRDLIDREQRDPPVEGRWHRDPPYR